jgi:hemerythrin-like metal-binding protein
MSFLKWEQKYELGIPEMDNQHKKWVEILNKFYEKVSKSDLQTNILEMVDEALIYTKYHFREEEKFMASMNYPKLKEQQKMHIDIISTLSNFKSVIMSKKQITSMEVTNELKKWFKEHIMIEDMKYAEFYLKQKKMK